MTIKNNIKNAGRKVSICRRLRVLLIALVATIPTACADSPFAEQEARNLPPFQKIEVGGLVNVVVSRGDEAAVNVRAYGIGIQDIITRVEDGVLLVTTTGSHSGESIAIDVIYTELLTIKTGVSATIKTSGVLTADTLGIEITGAGDANLELDVKRLNIEMRGNGNLKLRGRAGSQSVVSHGGGGSLDNDKLEITNGKN